MNEPIRGGWLAAARHCPSSNSNDRPPATDISLLVVHNISLPPGQYGTAFVEQFFCNQLQVDQHPYFQQIADLRVSAHLLIDRDGQLVQFVPLDRRAWHAGVSQFDGQADCNNFSIGIELEGSDHEAYTDRQYRRLAAVTRLLFAYYPALTPDRIAGHSDIAPGRKTDPGPAFDWVYFRSLLRE